MAQVTQAPCPGCQRMLRLPANWRQESLRCKHCGTVLHAKEPAASAFAFTEEHSNPWLTRQALRRRGRRWPAAVIALTSVAAVLATVGFFLWARSRLSLQATGDRQAGPAQDSVSLVDVARTLNRLPAEAPFPRRALLISVGNYLYANPVSYLAGKTGQEYPPLPKIATLWRVPADQVVELSDSVQREDAVPPLKGVIEQTVQEFLEGCRPQDRILLAFVGHAVEIDGAPYLAPIEGELTVKETLLPLGWLYEQLARCRARQKVLLIDVCRFDPGRGLERPGSGPMGPALDAALKNPPEGVQVWSACSAGQHSYEGETGAVFLQAIEQAMKPLLGKRLQRQPEPLPVETLAPLVLDMVAVDGKQTPRLSGSEAGSEAAYDPSEKMPDRLTVRWPAAQGDAAPPAEVRRILREHLAAFRAARP